MFRTAAMMLGAILACQSAIADDDAERLLEQARAAYQSGKYDDAARLAQAATAKNPKEVAAWVLAGRALAADKRFELAIKSFTTAIDLDPKSTTVYDLCGDAHLKCGQFKAAAEDFDRFLDANPDRAPEHWRRGIALYLAGRYTDGVKQFDLHRTVNPQDVENSAWHYLCNVRVAGRDAARKALLPVSRDARVPMAQVLDLYAGKLQPADVIVAAERAGLQGDRLTQARFYAHLYVALFYESDGDTLKAKEHLRQAVEKYRVPDYMWDVANVRLKALVGK